MGREYITNLCRAKMKDNNEWCVGYYVKGLDMYEKEVHLIFEATTIFYSHGETDALSKCEPFCLPMPLTEKYVKQCEMEIVDNPELLKKNGKTVRQNIFDILEA